MRELRSYGSVRGAISDDRPYRDLCCAREDPTLSNSGQDRRDLGGPSAHSDESPFGIVDKSPILT
jgi:hypothetical protein